MRVAFVPVWDGNPYHPELMNSLREQGIHVSGTHCLKTLFNAGEPVDIVHLHALPYFDCSPVNVGRYISFYRRLREMQKRGVKLVWTVHDFENHDTPFWPLENLVSRWASQWIDALIVHGNTAAQMIESKWGCRRISVIPHGNYIHSYKNDVSRAAARTLLELNDSNLTFLFLGLIRPYKGVEELVEAFKYCDAPNARLIIAGRPVDESMRRKVAGAIIGDTRIQFFPGFVKDDEIQIYMNASDVVVLPYRRILTSGAAVLAMSFGKPCIAPRAGCIGDTLDGNGAFFFDPQIGGDLEDALRHAMVCRGKLPMMGGHNLEKATSWDWHKIGGETVAVYRKLVNRVCAAKK